MSEMKMTAIPAIARKLGSGNCMSAAVSSIYFSVWGGILCLESIVAMRLIIVEIHDESVFFELFCELGRVDVVVLYESIGVDGCEKFVEFATVLEVGHDEGVVDFDDLYGF